MKRSFLHQLLIFSGTNAMADMPDLLKRNKLFLILFCLIIAAGLVPVLIYSKTELHLMVNRFHCNTGNIFFRYITFFGSGIAAAIACIILLFVRIRHSIILLVSWAVSGILVQLLKHLVFPGYERPVAVFGPDVMLNLVAGVEYHKHFSFPSGHAATAMVVFGLLAFISNRRWMKIFFMMCAAVVAYSRVYLSQHFIEDILFGSCLGFLTLIIFYWYFQRLKMDWADHSVQFYLRNNKR